MSKLYYAIATDIDTDKSTLTLEWYFYEHDFGGIEMDDDRPQNDLMTHMTAKEWYNWVKEYYPDLKVVRVL
jgi:hypothetical protein